MSGEKTDHVHPSVLAAELVLVQLGYEPHVPGRRAGFWVTAYHHPSGPRIRIEHREAAGPPTTDDAVAILRAEDIAADYHASVVAALRLEVPQEARGVQ